MASSRASDVTGFGRRSPIIRLNKQSGQLRRQAKEAVRLTALVRLRTSTGTSSCGRLEASLVSSSALSFSGSPQWAGTHCRSTRLPSAVVAKSRRYISAPSTVDWSCTPAIAAAFAPTVRHPVVVRRRGGATALFLTFIRLPRWYIYRQTKHLSAQLLASSHNIKNQTHAF